ncbi:diacylglycerol kinase family lipid kinase [Actinomadura craniellae]|uniref:Diacylglycerol kinase family lipid kinase n=1 Tax=Actinomadura craniellae TaxID=2231787 RepID=A0A365H3H2_9ACTN|nr:diacylglycerol kinase family lipid kinase [Actinomadura craniellae]
MANPKATASSLRARHLLVRAFADDLDLEIADTGHRGHATQLARRAVDEGHDVVIALGGDGTVNETVNGLLAYGPDVKGPALAVLPCGSTNVFARALGIPNEPIGATRLALDALRAGRYRSVGLGLADNRYFTFCAGMGLDAEVIRAVETYRLAGKRSDPALYGRAIVRQFFSGTDRRRPALTLERPGLASVEDLFMVLVGNTSPWTYLGRRPVNPTPRAHFNTGLDLFGVRSLALRPVLLTAARMLLPRTNPIHGADLVNVHDATEVTVRSSRPIAFQLDGDYLGERESVTFRSAPRAIRVVI